MSSYWSALLTTTTARVASIRQNLLSSEDDGDTDDDTHICRVLRSYYTENGRPFPAWLPSDPKAPPQTNTQPTYAQSNAGSKYGGIGSQSAASISFSSLFSAGNEQSNVKEAITSRQGRGQSNIGQEPTSSDKRNVYNRGKLGKEAPIIQSQPLPSTMAGSYQTTNMSYRGNNQSHQLSINPSSRPMSAKDRLKAGNIRRPDPKTSNSVESYRYNSSSTSGGSDKPFMAATSPWASNQDEFGGVDYEPLPKTKPRGLPSGPASGRKMGLPSGPRGLR